MLLRALALLLLFGTPAPLLQATSVRPPTFDQLVGGADLVVRGRVTAVRTIERPTADGGVPFTVVTVEVERALIGAAPAVLELEFLGGTIRDRTLVVTGQPKFAVGDRDILFVEGNGRQLCPLVHMMYGRYLLVPDAPNALVARANGEPLTRTADVSQPLHDLAHRDGRATSMASAPLTVAGFEDRIRLTARTLGRTDVAP